MKNPFLNSLCTLGTSVGRRKEERKKGRLLTSHRYNHLSLLPSGPGEVQQELVV